MQSSKMGGAVTERRAVPAVCLALAVAVWFIYGQTRHHDFVNFDDNEYIYENVQIKRGLTLDNVVLAFTGTQVHNWHPLTTLSNMVDVELYGLAPGGHHLTSVLLHAATAILLFVLLRTMTGALWPSAFAAALFAVHPLRVESVAWIAERKDVLSGLFFMLTLLAYVRHVRTSRVGEGPWRSVYYWLAVLLFGLGLMSKSMLVTLPFLLLLLDYWPLQRLAPGAPWPAVRLLLREKVPFLMLAAASSVVTVIAQSTAIVASEVLTVPWRLANAVVAYGNYVLQMAYPVDLAAFYPHPGSRLPLWKIVLGALFLAGASGLALASWRRRPYLLVGWLWYLGLLVPVIGILQVGSQAGADRYTYLPQIGLCIVIAWGAADLSRSWRHRRVVLATAAGAVLVPLLLLAQAQTAHWRDSVSLWTHALASAEHNARAHYNLGAAFGRLKRYDDALPELASALEIEPGYAEAHYNLGVALAGLGRGAEAIGHFRSALALRPDMPEARNDLGSALAGQGRWEEALREYREAVRLNPRNAASLSNLGMVEGQLGQLAAAISNYQTSLAIRPDNADARGNLGTLLGRAGRWAEALASFEQALALQPASLEARNNLAWLLATCPEAALRDGRRATLLAGGTDPNSLDTLAAAQAEAGDFPLAVATAERALSLAIAGNQPLAEDIRGRLRLYQGGSPYHEPPVAPLR